MRHYTGLDFPPPKRQTQPGGFIHPPPWGNPTAGPRPFVPIILPARIYSPVPPYHTEDGESCLALRESGASLIVSP